MNNTTKTAALSLETQDNFICGCMTFGGIMFIAATMIFLLQSSAAQALISVTVQ